MNKTDSPHTATSAWHKATLVFLGLFLSLALLEVGMRFGGFVLLSIQEYGNLRSIKQKGAYRILCLGESTTQGQYPYLLESVLNQRNIGVRFSVIDKGIAGTITFAILSGVDSYLAEYHPDMVVTMMGINDGGSHMPLEKLTTSKVTHFMRSLRVYKLARLLWLHLLKKAEEMGFYKPPAEGRSSATSETPFADAITTDAIREKTDIALDPETDKQGYAQQGVIFLDQGKLSEATASFKKAIEINPRYDDACYMLGLIFQQHMEPAQSEYYFKKAIEINPSNDDAHEGLGWVFQHQMKPVQSEYYFKKAVELNPANGSAYYGLGWLYKVHGTLAQAEASFEKAVEVYPGLNEYYFALGGVYRLQGEFSKAENLFKRALELYPQNDGMLGAMASLCEEMGKPDLASEYTEKLNRLRSERYPSMTVDSYRKLKNILDKKGIKLVCAQYPMRNVEPLKRIFGDDRSVIFVDNERVFKEAVKKGSYKEYFDDMFAGDFGHCTPKGNELLAQNIADTIFKEVFNK